MAKRHLIHDVTYNARICDLTDYNANICMLHLFQTLVHSSLKMFFSLASEIWRLGIKWKLSGI